MKTSLKISEIKTQEMKIIFPLIKVLNPDADEKRFYEILEQMIAEGYRCVGAWNGAELVGISGFWVGHRFWCDKFIEPDNVVVLPSARGLKVGQKLMQWIEDEGRRIGCNIIKLEAYATNTNAHRFYFNEDYLMPGKVFTKPLKISSREWIDKMNGRISA